MTKSHDHVQIPYTPQVFEFSDRILTVLGDPANSATGVSGHFNKAESRWKTALHVLTEKVIGQEFPSTAGGHANPFHSPYRAVCFAVLLLEEMELVNVWRSLPDPRQSNQVERIALR